MAQSHDTNGKRNSDDTEFAQGQGAVIDQEAERMLRDIESTTLPAFVLRASEDPEDLDPGIALEAGVHIAKSSTDINIDSQDDFVEPVDDVVNEPLDAVVEEEREAANEQTARLTRSRLHRVLVSVLVVFAAIAIIVGAVVWENSVAPELTESDTEALVTVSTSDNAAFTAVDGEHIPNLVSCFNKNVAAVIDIVGSNVDIESTLHEVDDSTMPDIKYERDGQIHNASGDTVANIAFCLNSAKKVAYIYCNFDLDALGVSDASFETLAGDSTVAASLLVDTGMSEMAASAAALTLSQNPDALVMNDKQDKEEATFDGATGLSQAPKSWRLTETYDHSTGTLVGDNSVQRNLLIEYFA